MKRYVVVANGARDFYQVPIALVEASALAGLVTDYYHGAWPVSIPRLAHRYAEQVPAELVVASAKAFFLQAAFLAKRRIVNSTRFPDVAVADALAKRASGLVLESRADGIFAYSGCAYDAFTKFPDKHRVLFQFHPSRNIIKSAISLDEMGNFRKWQQEPEVVDDRVSEIYSEEISSSDKIICASSFTRSGLELDGVDGRSIDIVPYGCPPVVRSLPVRRPKERRFLFAGQGVQRKGLHLLVSAWNSINPSGFSLRIISSVIDPEILDMIRKSRNPIEYSGRVSGEELKGEFEKSDTLVLPSLVEGFGLVLGEALSSGCRLIASTNTGLPDMKLPLSISSIVEPGSIDSLAEALRKHMDTFVDSGEHADLAKIHAEARSWSDFRYSVRSSLFA